MRTTDVDTPAGPTTVTIDGAGPSMLMLHGLTGLASRALASAPTGFTIAAFDQRGHGRGATPPPGSEAFAIDAFVDDAVAVLDQLGWAQATVAGESMGAAIAMRLALDHPDRVERLVLAAPAFLDEPNSEATRLNVLADLLETSSDLDATVATIKANQTAAGMPPAAVEHFEIFALHDPQVLARTIRDVMAWVPFPEPGRLAGLDVPAVVLGWHDDPLHPWPLAERAAALLDARLGAIADVFTALGNPATIGAALDLLLDDGSLK